MLGDIRRPNSLATQDESGASIPEPPGTGRGCVQLSALTQLGKHHPGKHHVGKHHLALARFLPRYCAETAANAVRPIQTSPRLGTRVGRGQSLFDFDRWNFVFAGHNLDLEVRRIEL